MPKEQPPKPEQPGRLENFLQNYGNFLGECSNHSNSLDTLIKDFTQSIPGPPESGLNNSQISTIYNKATSLSQESASDLAGKLRSLKQQKLQELISYTQQLNVTLNNEYEREINRAIDLGLYNKDIA